MSERTVVRETVRAGDLSPWAAFLALDDGGPAVFLDSARRHPRIGRYSVLAASPAAIWQARGRICTLRDARGTRRYEVDPAAELRRLLAERRIAPEPDLPPFAGGAIGLVSYEVRHAFERLPARAVDDVGMPHWYVLFADEALVFDHEADALTAVVAAHSAHDRDAARDRAAALLRRAAGPPARAVEGFRTCGAMTSSFGREEFAEAVRRTLAYIGAGDVYQVNLSQRLAVPVEGDPRALYGVLREINPSPFASFLRGDDFALVGSSPERLVCMDPAGNAETRPIAGTRPRGANAAEDERLRAELILNAKERAEHIMLVDLERNDLGRVCRYGTVRVDELMVLERYSHVNHIVSNVVGELAEGRDAIDLLAAMFPGGTITGCPKIRCMEIIDELEPVARHAYTGSVGFFSDTGAMDMNIVIRTFTIAGGNAHIQVGAGIVADSDPYREYDETLDKAEALLAALRQVSTEDRREVSGEK